jgi:hypothetical protein
MPMQIQRPATVYFLWDDSDVRALFDDLSAAGWLCTLTVAGGAWQVGLQNTAAKQLVTAPTTSVVVSDLVNVFAQTVAEFNAANPDHAIEEPGS